MIVNTRGGVVATDGYKNRLLLELAYNNSNNNLIIHIFNHEVQSNAGPFIPSPDPILTGQSIIPGNQAIQR